MNLEFLTNDFFVEVGFITLVSSFLTLLSTQIVKLILQKRKIITDKTNSSRKDHILSLTGRAFALFFYSFLFLGNEYFKNQTIELNKTLILGLFSGATLTLTCAKAFYTMLHQYFQKQHDFEKLEDAEKTIINLKKEIIDLEDSKSKVSELNKQEILKTNQTRKWIFKNNKGE